MTDREVETLITRHFQGTATGAESDLLFRHALDDQELFDRLAALELASQLAESPQGREALRDVLSAPSQAGATKTKIWAFIVPRPAIWVPVLACLLLLAAALVHTGSRGDEVAEVQPSLGPPASVEPAMGERGVVALGKTTTTPTSVGLQRGSSVWALELSPAHSDRGDLTIHPEQTTYQVGGSIELTLSVTEEVEGYVFEITGSLIRELAHSRVQPGRDVRLVRIKLEGTPGTRLFRLVMLPVGTTPDTPGIEAEAAVVDRIIDVQPSGR